MAMLRRCSGASLQCVEGDGRAEARGGRKRRGRILLVDEATASLDAATDAAVQSTIKSSIEFAGVTTHSS